MTSTDLMPGVHDYRLLFIDHAHMWPEIRRDSVVFLSEPGYRGEGVYSLAYEGVHHGELRRISPQSRDRMCLSMDNWPGEPQWCSREGLKRCKPCKVAGVVNSFDRDFTDFLRFRFRGVRL